MLLIAFYDPASGVVISLSKKRSTRGERGTHDVRHKSAFSRFSPCCSEWPTVSAVLRA